MDLVFKRSFKERRRPAMARRCVAALLVSISLGLSSKVCGQLAVELSAAFKVVAVLLKARGKTVSVRNAPASHRAHFALEGVELNPSAELRGLLVRAVN